MTFDKEELAWAAGLFDGEGNSILREYNVAAVNMGQSDRFVLDRFKTAIGGFGTIGLNKNGKDSHGDTKWMWRYQTARAEYVQHIMCVLWKWLSPIKKEQIRSVMTQQIKNAKKNNYSMSENAIRCRDIRKYGSVHAAKKARWDNFTKDWPKQPFINPFAKKNDASTA
jgi:hypothetical protein